MKINEYSRIMGMVKGGKEGSLRFEKYLRAIWEYCVNLVTYSRLSVSLLNFILNWSCGYFFCSIWNYFLLFLWGVLFIWLYYTLIPIWPRKWYGVPATKPLAPISTAFTISLYRFFSSSFLKIFIFASFILVASYGFHIVLIILPRWL